MKRKLVSNQRGYKVVDTSDAKKLSGDFLQNEFKINKTDITFGLPEIDDRFHIWRVPIRKDKEKIGEVVINAKNGIIDKKKTTTKKLILKRLEEAKNIVQKKRNSNSIPIVSTLHNTVILGDCIKELAKLPKESINLVFTSPPYYNAKPEYSEYTTYEEYLEFMREVIKSCHRVLSEGRFFSINVSPVLLRRASRNESSKRIAVPFDLHRLFIDEGFEFVDDIHWVKPEGAGWSFGRGRRFAADRNPLQYKPVPVTEYVLVYRKSTDKLIDWNIRKHHNQADVQQSKVEDGYETTNLWRINPSRSKHHPATFPTELAEKIIKYYSFKNDVVLDPFGGIGTTAKAAINLMRKFVTIEINKGYVDHTKGWLSEVPSLDIDQIDFINTDKPKNFNLKLKL